ncbi:MAG: spore coat protein CotJB [Eubacteriales bacterium]
MNSTQTTGCFTTPTDPSEPTVPGITCADECGVLPTCAGLAVPYVPFQQNEPKKYSQMEALSNGTLYPGLNLPFHLQVAGGTLVETPLVELQALDFVLTELGHFLDTHPDDTEAFTLFKQYAAMAETARTEYENKYGPLTRPASAKYDNYCWLSDPWPWNYAENEVK